jgi:hypothetical protein
LEDPRPRRGSRLVELSPPNSSKLLLVTRCSPATFRAPPPGGIENFASATTAVISTKKKSNFSLTAAKVRLKCSSRNASGFATIGEQFFQLLGLQIAPNLVPTKKRASQDANFDVGAKIGFFVARKLGGTKSLKA